MKTIIKVENISKVYQVDNAQEGMNFREMLKQQMSSLFKKDNKKKPFYALNNVSFEVKQGEVLGIIGKNGSGKSTLLKILSKITAPTSGKITVKGRVASLLEVGTGFHPELTGRENIFMNGVILGMKRCEVLQHFDEIVSFAGVEQFLDVPVKKYSSGMRLRLAFSVAAHLQPEILVVDEVLAVGDYEFEKKCLKLMEGITQAGRTIIFVSHNMDTIKRLCTRVVWLDRGVLKQEGLPETLISQYLGYNYSKSGIIQWNDYVINESAYYFALHHLKVADAQGCVKTEFSNSEDIYLSFSYSLFVDKVSLLPLFSFFSKDGILIFSTIKKNTFVAKDQVGRKNIVCKIPKNTFYKGIFFISVSFIQVDNNTSLFKKEFILSLDRVMSISIFDYNDTSDVWESNEGLINPLIEWL